MVTPGARGAVFAADLARLRWALSLGVAAMAVIGVVLLFLLTLATNNRELYGERNYARLFTINVVVAVALLLDRLDRRAAGAAPAPRQVWQPAAGQAGCHLCAGPGWRPAC